MFPYLIFNYSQIENVFIYSLFCCFKLFFYSFAPMCLRDPPVVKGDIMA